MHKPTDDRKTILLVEDEAIVALAQANTIEDFGYRVVRSGNGEDAVRKAIADPEISLILMDIDLGAGISGPEAAQQILQQRHVPVVFLTSHSSKPYVDQVKAITRYGYVVKNSGNFVLQEAIEMAFQLFDRYQQLQHQDQQLQVERANFQHLFQNAPVAMLLVDQHNRAQACNSEFTRLFQYSEQEIQNRKVSRLIVPESLREQHARIAHSVQNQQTVDCETQRQRKDGVLIDVAIYAVPLDLPDRRVVHAAYRDISARKQVERELENSKRFAERVLDSVPDPVFVKDDQLRFRMVNAAYCRLTGFDRDELIGRTSYDLFAPEQAAFFATIDRQVLASGEQSTNEEPFTDRAGVQKVNWTRKTRVTIAETEQKLLVGVVREITDHSEYRTRHVEARLAQEQQLMRLLLDSSPDYIYIKDTQSRFSRISRSLAELYGILSPEEAVGKTDFDFYPHNSAAQYYAAEQNMMQTLKSIIGVEQRQAWASGEEGWVSTTKFPIYDGEGRVSGLFGISRDISAIKAAEQRVGGLLAEKELLLREAYHRIKNDMYLVRSLLSLQATASGNPDTRDALHSSASRISVIARTYEQVYQSGDLQTVALRSLIDSVVQSLRQLTSVSGCAIQAKSDESTVRSRVSVAIGVIINELVTNAVKHAFDGVTRPRIEIDVRRAGADRIRITLQDNGSGFPPPLLEGHSDGFGVTIVRALVQQHKGTVAFSNTNGGRVDILLQIADSPRY